MHLYFQRTLALLSLAIAPVASAAIHFDIDPATNNWVVQGQAIKFNVSGSITSPMGADPYEISFNVNPNGSGQFTASTFSSVPGGSGSWSLSSNPPYLAFLNSMGSSGVLPFGATFSFGTLDLSTTGVTLGSHTVQVGSPIVYDSFGNLLNLPTPGNANFYVTSPNAILHTWTGSTNNTWDTSSSNWTSTQTPFWLNRNAPADIAVFNNAGNVNVAGGINVNRIDFTGNTSLTGGSLNLIANGSTQASIDTSSGATATISTSLNGSASLTKTGDGTLTLSALNTFTGGTTVSAGVLNIAVGGQLIAGHLSGIGNPAGNGIDAVVVNGTGALNNAGTITGGNGNSTYTLNGANGGHGVVLNAATVLTNTGTINGGSGAIGSISDGAPAAAVQITAGGTLDNSGILTSPEFAVIGINQASTLINRNTGTIYGVTLANFANQVTLEIGSTINGDLNLGNSTAASLTLTDDGTGGSQTYSSAALGTTTFAGSLTKTGTGTWILDQPFSHTAGTNVNAGTLQVSSSANLGTGGVTLAGGELFVNATTSIQQPLTFTANTSSQLITDRPSTVTYTGSFSGSGTVKFLGNRHILAGPATNWTGNIEVNRFTFGSGSIAGSILQVGNGGTTGELGSGPVKLDSSTLEFNRSDAITVPNPISGFGAVQIRSGDVTLTGTNSFDNDLRIESATVQVASNLSLGAPRVPSLEYRIILFASPSSTLRILGTDISTLARPVATFGSGTIDVVEPGHVVHATSTYNAAGEASTFTKAGLGTLEFINNYGKFANITVTEGTLRSSATHTLAGTLSVHSGARLHPGTNLGDSPSPQLTLTGGTLSFDPGSELGVSILSPTTSTQLLRNPNDISLGLDDINLYVDLLNTPLTGQTYSFTIATGMGDQSALFINDPARFTFVNLGSYIISNPEYFGSANGELFLNFTIIPEPASLSLLVGTAALLLRRRSR